MRLRCCASTFLHCSNTHGKRNVLQPIAIWARICIVHSAQCTRYLAFHLCASRICTFWAHLSFTSFNQTLVVARSWNIQDLFVRSFVGSVGRSFCVKVYILGVECWLELAGKHNMICNIFTMRLMRSPAEWKFVILELHVCIALQWCRFFLLASRLVSSWQCSVALNSCHNDASIIRGYKCVETTYGMHFGCASLILTQQAFIFRYSDETSIVIILMCILVFCCDCVLLAANFPMKTYINHSNSQS